MSSFIFAFPAKAGIHVQERDHIIKFSYAKYAILLLLISAIALFWTNFAFSQTEWVKYEGNPVLDVGPKGSWDEVFISDPSVIFTGNYYKMWYYGNDSSSKSRIGHAISTDGIHWEKHIGNPVLDLGDDNAWDSFCVRSTCVIFDGLSYKMWYSGWDSIESSSRIGYATSKDGITWEKNPNNPVLDLGSNGEWDDYQIYEPVVLFDGSEYKMWYSGSDKYLSGYKIGYATSKDGITWKKYLGNPIFKPGITGSWDDYRVTVKSIIHDETGYKMYYRAGTGSAYGRDYRIGYATSLDGISWVRHPENPILEAGANNSWDSKEFDGCSVIKNNGKYKMWYSARESTIWRIGYATSPQDDLPTPRKLMLSETEAAPGEQTTIHISINETKDMASGDIIVRYDPDILVVDGARITDLLSGMSYVVNNNTPGELGIFIAGAQGLAAGSGDIIDIDITVRATAKADTETSLIFDDSTQIYDELGEVIPVELEDGKLKIVQPGLKGDVNGDGNVRSNDATLALRIAAGLTNPTAYQLWAADMNDDGNVRSNDATLILRKAAGLSAPELPLLINVIPSIKLGEILGKSVDRASVPLMADDAGPIGSGDIQIAYDASVLRAANVSSKSNIILAGNINEPGLIRIAFASTDKLENGTLAMLEFEVLTDKSSPLIFKGIELFGHDALSIDSRAINGSFKAWSMPAESSALMQNFPNPFNPETWIPYQLKSDSHVIIKIHDSSGRLMNEIDLGYKSAGYYTNKERAAYWNGRNSSGEKAASGVYFYTIEADEFVNTRKLIIAK